jgi:hypothetical protein
MLHVGNLAEHGMIPLSHLNFHVRANVRSGGRAVVDDGVHHPTKA